MRVTFRCNVCKEEVAVNTVELHVAKHVKEMKKLVREAFLQLPVLERTELLSELMTKATLEQRKQILSYFCGHCAYHEGHAGDCPFRDQL